MNEDRPTLIYYVQTVLNTFKRDVEQGFVTKDKEYAIELLEKAMECQHDIWNDAIEESALASDKLHDNEKWSPAYQRPAKIIAEKIRKLKK